MAWTLFVFALGVSIGSFVNVAAYRLPFEKSIAWPDSRCMSCLQVLNKWDNLPLIGYLRTRGRCRNCGIGFSSRYFWVELAVGLIFVGIYWIE
ncbi:MAG: prepilin peptidase, partial [Gemmataceae bacterium]